MVCKKYVFKKNPKCTCPDSSDHETIKHLSCPKSGCVIVFESIELLLDHVKKGDACIYSGAPYDH
jgi:hypothetical protein